MISIFPVERKLTAFMFTYIVGYSKIMATNENFVVRLVIELMVMPNI